MSYFHCVCMNLCRNVDTDRQYIKSMSMFTNMSKIQWRPTCKSTRCHLSQIAAIRAAHCLIKYLLNNIVS